MPTSFQEFLKQKAEGTGIQERNQNRSDWLGPLRMLLHHIENWLRAADTEHVLEIMPYDVEGSRTGWASTMPRR